MNENKYWLVKIFVFGIIFAMVFGTLARMAIKTVHAAAPETAAVATSGDATPTDLQVATSTDPQADKHPYLSQNSVNGDTMTIADLLLSIRNILIMFMFFEILKWGHQVLKGVITGFHKRR